jgi:Tfp pilus assembly protein PilV
MKGFFLLETIVALLLGSITIAALLQAHAQTLRIISKAEQAELIQSPLALNCVLQSQTFQWLHCTANKHSYWFIID